MNTTLLVEIFGYLGSALVVVSMLMSSVVKLRVINTIGSVISGTYALIIGSFPLALMNICLIVINLYGLWKLLSTKASHDLVRCSPDDGSIGYFLDLYRQDIQTYFPHFRGLEEGTDTVYLVYCDGAPAGILLGEKLGDGTVRLSVEYSTPAYRDCSIGKYLYSTLPSEGIKILTVEEFSEGHREYLEKMGYQKNGSAYTLKLN